MAARKSDEEPDTKPDAPRSLSQEFSLEALRRRIEGEAAAARASGTNMVPVVYLEQIMRNVEAQLASFSALIKAVLRHAPTCGKCGVTATQRHGAAIWCDEHAPDGSIDIPGAGALRRAMKI